MRALERWLCLDLLCRQRGGRIQTSSETRVTELVNYKSTTGAIGDSALTAVVKPFQNEVCALPAGLTAAWRYNNKSMPAACSQDRYLRSFSTRATNVEGWMSNASDSLHSVVSVGCRMPRSI